MFGSNAAITVSGAANNGFVSGLTAADLFDTGSLDLIGIVDYPNPAGGQLTVFTNNGSGIFGTDLLLGVPNSGGLNVVGSVAVADVNGDGKPDVITLTHTTTSSETLTIYTNNGAGGFSTNFTQQISTGFFTGLGGSVIAADLAGNGRTELVVLIPGAPWKFTVFTNVGVAGPFLPQNSISNITYTVGNNVDSMIAADVTGDGKLDLIFANNTFPGTLTVMTNSGNGVFGLGSSPVVGAFPSALAAADVNSDGKLDLITANFGPVTNSSDFRGPLSYGTLSVLTNNGSGLFTNLATTFSTGPGPTAVIALDVNGDGKPDLITANTTTFSNQSTVFYGTGGNSLSVLLNTSNSVNLVAFQTAPSYTGITYGQYMNTPGLSGVEATNLAGVVVAGSFTFTNPFPPAGTATYPVTFAATPPTDYQPVTVNVSVTVSQLVVILRGTRAYDTTTNCVHNSLSVSNRVNS